ncbi:MAG: integral rane sensor signal transduction histidine kinase, partial [Solirubrobacterales bacterium]|nr:integral rane sensor signal transduction histidine kinase [Solirubrobacterales bacterium]
MAEEATRTSSRRDALSRLGVAMPGPSHDPEEAAARVSRQLWAASRAVLGVVLVVGGLVAPDLTPVFWVLLVLRMLLVGTALRWHPTRRQQVLTTPLDIALATGLLLTSGGSDSPLVIALIGLPVIGGYLVRTRLVVLIGAGTALTATLASLPHLLEGRPGAPRELLALLLVLAFSTLAGVGFTLGRRELARRTAEVDDARRRLLHAGLGAEDRERRRVSHDLHGEALQVLLAAAQDLDEEDPEGLRRARAGIRSAVLAIRETVRDLHPAALRHAGLQASVRAALEHRVHDVVGVRVEADADGVREALLLSVVRELGDALAQAGVDEAVAARVSRGPGAVVLAVSATAGRDAVERLRGTLAGVA